jgi:hypothetical protein
MGNRTGVAAVVLLVCAPMAWAQQNMFKIELIPSGAMVSLSEPLLVGGTYVFRAWPDGGSTNLSQASVRKITRLTGPASETIYQLELIPSGTMTARDKPALKGTSYVFHTWHHGTLMSVRQSDVRKIIPMTGDQAFWVEQGVEGEKSVGNFAMQGSSNVVLIGTPSTQRNSSQAGPTNLSSVGQRGGTAGISGAPAYGNWQYQGTPGVSDAWAPANATVSSPGGVPQMPAATDGTAPPQ